MAVTRTTGPLHFEDLEPKRFEDLVRQLIYDFKPWRRLEATGRSGSDDGFDARGYEIVGAIEQDISDDEEAERPITPDRLWLLQCKREKVISPKKLTSYLSDIRISDSEKLHGVVFAAACDFSKKSRDVFRLKCEEFGIEEWHLWGKAELEDMLFLPKNDSLLFAYFGVSLTIRRRNQKAAISSRLVVKRKANRLLGDKRHQTILLRDASASHYPYFLSQEEEFKPSWLLQEYRGLHYDGLLFLTRRHFAYLNDDATGWDAALAVDDAAPHDDPWLGGNDNWEARSNIHAFWSSLPASNQAWFEVTALVPFESIIDIDDIGDDRVQNPHVYVEFNDKRGPFVGYAVNVLCAESWSNRGFQPDHPEHARIVVFEEQWRKRGKPRPYSS